MVRPRARTGEIQFLTTPSWMHEGFGGLLMEFAGGGLEIEIRLPVEQPS